jgi:cysteine synthase A
VISTSAADAIGRTPLVALDRITAGIDGRILAKLEMLNPGFSKKDRAARQIIVEARDNGSLKEDQPVVELTSGNMGTGLAIVCAVYKHPFIAVMSKGNSEERTRMMSALGAEVILVEQLPDSTPGEVSGGDLALVEQAARRITEERGAFRADQFEKSANANAHYLGTGPEIFEQAGGELNAFCDFVGSGGTFAGCSRFFKEQDLDIRCYIVEPEGAEAIAGKSVSNPSHPIQGGGYSMQELRLLEDASIDGFVAVTTHEAIETTRRLAREEGIFAGYSTGANLAAALKLLDGPEQGHSIAIVVCDSGLKYLSTDLWQRV